MTNTTPKIKLGQIEEIGIPNVIGLSDALSNIPDPGTPYIHPTQSTMDTGALSGNQVIARIAVNEFGHTTNISTRAITAANIGAQPAGSYEVTTNKSTSTALGTSNILYPTQGAVKSYVDNAIVGKANNTVSLTAGDGLTGGGNLTTNRAFAVDATVLRTNDTDQTKTGIFRIRRGSASAEMLHTAWEYPDNLGNNYNLRLYNDGTDDNVKWYYKQKVVLGVNNVELEVPVLGFKNGVTVIGDSSYPAIGLEIEDFYNAQTNPATRHKLRLYVDGLSQFEEGIVVGTTLNQLPVFDGNTKAYIEGDVILGAASNSYRTIGADGTSVNEAYISMPNYSSFNRYNARITNGHYFTAGGSNLASISGNGIASIIPGGSPGTLGPSWKLGNAVADASNVVDRIIRIQIGTTEYDLLARAVV